MDRACPKQPVDQLLRLNLLQAWLMSKVVKKPQHSHIDFYRAPAELPLLQSEANFFVNLYLVDL